MQIIKEAFVYPNDVCANSLVTIFGECLGKFEAEFIDDKDAHSNLLSKKEKILEVNKPLLICAGEVGDILFQKCSKNGIEAFCGREYAAKLLAKQFRNITNNIDNESILSYKITDSFIIENDILHIKNTRLLEHYSYIYFGFLRFLKDEVIEELNDAVRQYCKAIKKELKKVEYDLSVKRGVCLDVNKLVSVQSLALDKFLKVQKIDTTLFFWDYDSYLMLKDKLKNTKIIIAPWILSDFFTPRRLVWMYSKNRPRLRDEKRIIVGAGHSVCDAFDNCMLTLRKVEKIAVFQFLTFDYYLAIDENSFIAYDNMFKEYGISTKPLKAGSPSLDKKILENVEKYSVKYFYYIPKSTEIKKIIEVIRVFLQAGKKIKFRPHMNIKHIDNYTSSNMYSPLDEFLSHPNFSIDKSSKITQQALCESIVITDTSSVAYSTPYTSLKPTLLFAPNKKEYDLKQVRYGFSFANPILHRVGESVGELLYEALKLEKEVLESGMELKNKLKNFRDENIYNLGRSQQEIEKIMLKLYKESNLINV